MIGILRETTPQQLADGLRDLQSLLAKLTQTIPRFVQAVFDESFQTRIWEELVAMRTRIQRLESAKEELEERKKQVMAAQKEVQEQVLQTRRRGRRLRQATEQALNGLFPSVHVSLVGDVMAL